jgi:hypothetical protein
VNNAAISAVELVDDPSFGPQPTVEKVSVLASPLNLTIKKIHGGVSSVAWMGMRELSGCGKTADKLMTPQRTVCRRTTTA